MDLIKFVDLKACLLNIVLTQLGEHISHVISVDHAVAITV